VQSGTVEGIYLSEKAKRLPVAVDSARVVAGRGLEGDRYFLGKGSFSHWRGTGRALTLVEAEALEDVGLGFDASRRNVVTRGVDLNALVGRRFRVGSVECLGRRLCEPCRHLEKLERDGLMRALAGRGGLRADVLSDGSVAVGDAVIELSDSDD
jgi:MOSC domain-containing protein YiiM